MCDPRVFAHVHSEGSRREPGSDYQFSHGKRAFSSKDGGTGKTSQEGESRCYEADSRSVVQLDDESGRTARVEDVRFSIQIYRGRKLRIPDVAPAPVAGPNPVSATTLDGPVPVPVHATARGDQPSGPRGDRATSRWVRRRREIGSARVQGCQVKRCR